jgi:hypothetical protein
MDRLIRVPLRLDDSQHEVADSSRFKGARRLKIVEFEEDIAKNMLVRAEL